MKNLAVICPSEIAFRRFMPALQGVSKFKYIGLGVFNADERVGQPVSGEEMRAAIEFEHQKAKVFSDKYGGEIFNSYKSVVTSDKINAVYVPLPPALHFQWAKLALESGKHVLCEKPLTMTLGETQTLVDIAKTNRLALHENYMFVFHNQLKALDEIIQSGAIGEVRLYRISFGFPRRAANDFRYIKQLGGGSLYDAGGYTIKYASLLLGKTAKVCCAHMNHIEGFDVDMYGSGTLINSDGVVAQISFGMDNQYKCELEVWGSKGALQTGRVLTAPVGFVPQATVIKGQETEVVELPPDDSFGKSIKHFEICIEDEVARLKTYEAMLLQAELVDRFYHIAKESE